MNSIKAAFSKQKVLIPYTTFGDPTAAFTEKLIRQSFDAGAGIMELGIPFSDPIADGPIIQASHQRALKHLSGKPLLPAAFKMIERVKSDYSQPIVLMLSFNLVYIYGIKKFFKNAASAGVSGVVIPDLPVESADLVVPHAKRHKIATIFLASPLSGENRLKKIVKASTGFVYLISRTGTTGEGKGLNKNIRKLVTQIKRIHDIPVAVGFGIRSREQVQEVFGFADGAIVGSCFVRMIEENLGKPGVALDRIAKSISEFLG